MYTTRDIEYRTIFVINCRKERTLRVSNGELLLEEYQDKTSKNKTITKFPFQKILAIFVIGNMSITTPLIEKCHRHGVSLIVTKFSLRPVFYWSNYAEGNFVLHKRQYELPKDDITIAKALVANKISNQIKLLKNTRKTDAGTKHSIRTCEECATESLQAADYKQLLGIEGMASKSFFSTYFRDYDWKSRKPRIKRDLINATMDIGYTVLFNFTECFLRMFGFDVYIGVYHRLWFKRKSLVCDIIEPFRCIIDKTIRTALNKGQFKETDFNIVNGEYLLRREVAYDYYNVFYEALIPYKKDFFSYIQSYYRCFVGDKNINQYPKFLI